MSIGFAKKLGMTRLFVENKSVPVTVLELEETFVLQRKTVDKDGYSAIQVGAKKVKKVSNPLLGHIKTAIEDADYGFGLISEFEGKNVPEDKSSFNIADYSENNLLDITGVSVGRGFTHGHDHTKAVGSIGARWPQRVAKGKKMAGKHGKKALTLKKVKIVAIDTELGLLFVNGSMPGANSSYLKVQKVK
jgi:large subunit ribosomal protein L3